MNTRADLKEYKKKMGEDIKQYLDLKKNIRKCNYSSNSKSNKMRAKS